DAARLAKIEDADFGLRPKHAKNLSQAGIVVGQVAETKRRDHQVHCIIGQRELQSVSLHGLDLLCGVFAKAVAKHLVRKIQRINSGAMPLRSKSYRHIAGSGTKVKNAGVIAPEDVSKSPGCATPPQTVNVHGQDVVCEIIAGSDLVKHPLDSLCSGTLVG